MRYRIIECRNCGSEFPIRGLVKDLDYLECPVCGCLPYTGNFRVIGRSSKEKNLAHILHNIYSYDPEEIAEIIRWQASTQELINKYNLKKERKKIEEKRKKKKDRRKRNREDKIR